MNELPQHRILTESLREDILTGRYVPGDLLPSEHALCTAHSVTRPTVRQALGTLVSEGYIRKRKGKGSIVQVPPTGIGILSIVSTTDSVAPGDLRTEVVEPQWRSDWSDDFPFELSDRIRGSKCIVFGRKRSIRGQPVIFERTYMPDEGIDGFCEASLADRSVFALLAERYKMRVVGGHQRIWADSANEDLAELLACDPGDPVVRLQKRYQTDRPDYCFYTMLWCNTQHYYLQGSL